MKRIVSFIQKDGKLEITSISAPIDENDPAIANSVAENPNAGFIDAGYTDPQYVKDKKISLYYVRETETVEVVYSDKTFDDLSTLEKIAFLKSENADLKAENKSLEEANISLSGELMLTQDALFEVDSKVETIIGSLANGGVN